jgi:hypothetical protein
MEQKMKKMSNDEAILSRVLATSWLGDPVSEEDIDAFEGKLSVKLPALFRQLLLRANGGEFVFARMHQPFIPQEVASMSTQEVWEHVLAEARETLVTAGLTSDLRGNLLPFGDDYSGVVIGFDLRKGKNMQVIEGYFADFNANSLDDFDVIGSFKEFVVKSIADADAAEKAEPVDYNRRIPAGREHDAAVQKVRSVFGGHVTKIEPFLWQNPSQNGQGLWFEVQHKDFTFFMQHSLRQIPSAEFGYFRVATRQGDDVIVVKGDELRREVFTNMHAANDRCQDANLSGFSESPLGFEKARLTSDSKMFLIYETTLLKFTDSETGYGMQFCVLALQNGKVSRFLFNLLGQDLKQHETAVVKFLLSFGFSWA